MMASMRLRPDNFTPATRTPWGGRVILDRIKKGLELAPEKAAYPVVGESWEVSVEPAFPSRFATGELLSEWIAADPVGTLGQRVWDHFGGYPLLVKLLDAAAPLSVQVHPSDDYAPLESHQCGKPESWVIVSAQPGSGLYFGLKQGVGRADVERVLRDAGDLAALLNFVEVAPGDCFEIAAGTIHAIGAGVTLVEPQQVIPGRQGVTYRYWDWNRRYDADGNQDPGGSPRELHVNHSLAVTRFDGPRGAAFIDAVRRPPKLLERAGAATRERFIDGPAFTVERLRGSGEITLTGDTLLALVVVEGQLSVGAESYRAGESLVIAASALPTAVRLVDASAILSHP